MASTSTLLGQAGEHYVMAQLLRRGFIAALAPVGVPNSDILVTDELGDRLCAIQVKARVDKGSDGGWHMRAKHETIKSPFLFYAFVDFGSSLASIPKTYLLPSVLVAQTIRDSHASWLSSPGKRGQKRTDMDLRRMLPDYGRLGIHINRDAGWLEQYLESWNLLVRPENILL